MGLSPRVRGNLQVRKVNDVYFGSIPACAGEPCRGLGMVRVDQVYPRVCGGTYGTVRYDPRIVGLSPRVRGNLYGGEERGGDYRSIPACAGEPPALISLNPNPPKDTDGRREDRGRGGEGATGGMAWAPLG